MAFSVKLRHPYRFQFLDPFVRECSCRWYFQHKVYRVLFLIGSVLEIQCVRGKCWAWQYFNVNTFEKKKFFKTRGRKNTEGVATEAVLKLIVFRFYFKVVLWCIFLLFIIVDAIFAKHNQHKFIKYCVKNIGKNKPKF